MSQTARTLPHDAYIDAVTVAFAEVGLNLADGWTSDAETHGLYCYLSAVLSLTAEDSGLDSDEWPEGLLLIWEWHTGIEAGEPDRGPSWLWAEKNADGSNSQPEPLPVDGFTNPVQLAAATHELITTNKAVKRRPGQWNGTPGLQAAIAVWEETS